MIEKVITNFTKDLCQQDYRKKLVNRFFTKLGWWIGLHPE